MNYLTVETTIVDGVYAQTIHRYATMQEAVAAFHYFLFFQSSQPDCTHALCMVIDDYGAVYRTEEYIKPAEPEETPAE